MSAAPARRHNPAPRERERLAEVIPLFRNRSHPRRRPTNGHHADCPYPKADPVHCSVCSGIRKGKP